MSRNSETASVGSSRNSMSIHDQQQAEQCKLEQPLLVDEAGADGNSTGDNGECGPHTATPKPYQPVIKVGKQYLLGCIEMEPAAFAQISLCFQVCSVLSLLSSLHSANDQESVLTKNMIGYTDYFVLLCWLAVPMWQCYTLRRADNGQALKLDGGFILCRLAWAALEVCCGRYRLVENSDEEEQECAGNDEGGVGGDAVWSEVAPAPAEAPLQAQAQASVASSGAFPTGGDLAAAEAASIAQATETGNITAPRRVRVTRFLPFSLFNLIYMIEHPGKQLNSALPSPEELPELGFSRSLLLVLSVNALGTLNSYLLIYAFAQLDTSIDNNPLSRGLAIASAVMAVIGYQVTLLSMAAGVLLLPYTLGLYVALFVCDLFHVTNPRRDSCVYRMLTLLWEFAVRYSY